jgi:carbamoyltransferase
MTQYLGFPNYGDEYKVMGLAPYGKPVYLDQMRDVVHLNTDGTFKLNLKYFRHHNENVKYEWEGGSPVIDSLFNAKSLQELLGFPARDSKTPVDDTCRNLARSVQAMYEESFFNILNCIHGKYGVSNLSLAGGCAMNSVANGMVYRNTPFTKVYIQSAAGDAGGAIGAAFALQNRLPGNSSRFHMNHSYWGPEFSNDDIEKILRQKYADSFNDGFLVKKTDEDELIELTANAIADGKVIGWFQNRMEWGPRALGNRSILGDPRRADMKDILNHKIKRRESFRPFAPSVLRERVPEWFENDDDVPFMMQVYQIKKDKREKIPAVTHVDGSGRLQTVSADTNTRYHSLIKKFEEITGVPMLLNTSFNENEPVVCKPEEAIDCFLRTKMDVLVMQDWLIQRV